jgi:outer membrane protein assembly factor BamB
MPKKELLLLLNAGRPFSKDIKRAALDSYTPRYAKPPGPERNSLLRLVSAIAIFSLGLTVGAWIWMAVRDDGTGPEDLVLPQPTPSPIPISTPPSMPMATPIPVRTPTPSVPSYQGWVDPDSVGQPWGSTVNGLLTFRGNPTRTYYGEGPIPQDPTVKWSYPSNQNMCGLTTLGGESQQWCGTGWTGQPAVFSYRDQLWVVFGALDGAVHFVNAETGEPLLNPYQTEDIIKGSVTIDPDGFPLAYIGSRDDKLRVLAFDRDEPVELWNLDADTVPGKLWNNDWDGAPLIIDDYLFEGGENSIFHIVKLNRSYDSEGLATVAPELLVTEPGYDDDLLFTVGSNVSIENSVAISGNTVYFANSGGLVQGWDITDLEVGVKPVRTFRYWAGDDVDASIVIDAEGYLYVGVEYERGFSRSLEVGQVIKLDPKNPEDPLIWSVFDTAQLPDGVWATPALYRDIVIVATDSARMIGIDKETGDIRWEFFLPGPLWSSPVVVDDVLIQADCAGNVTAFDISDTSIKPPELWDVYIGGCIESTPAVWDGKIIVGSRDGQVHMVAD